MALIFAFSNNLKQICTDLRKGESQSKFQSCISVHIFKTSLKCLSQFCGLTSTDGEDLNLQDGLHDL